jgi:hypothetical protein
MRAFIISCLAIIVVAIGAFWILGSAQKPADVAFSTPETRVDPGQGWRQEVSAKPGAQTSSMSKMSEAAPAASCGKPDAWTYMVTDFFGTPTADPVCGS